MGRGRNGLSSQGLAVTGLGFRVKSTTGVPKASLAILAVLESPCHLKRPPEQTDGPLSKETQSTTISCLIVFRALALHPPKVSA